MGRHFGATRTTRSRLFERPEEAVCRRYVSVDYARQFFDEGHPVTWTNVNLPSGWLLNSMRVLSIPSRAKGVEVRRDLLPLVTPPVGYAG
jgi:hypothetical protein